MGGPGSGRHKEGNFGRGKTFDRMSPKSRQAILNIKKKGYLQLSFNRAKISSPIKHVLFNPNPTGPGNRVRKRGRQEQINNIISSFKSQGLLSKKFKL